MSMKISFQNYSEVVTLSDFVIIAQTHARVPYSFSGWMVVHCESIRLEKMSVTLENLVEMMSPIYFEIVALFHKDFQTLF